jgi:hypothetical protein
MLIAHSTFSCALAYEGDLITRNKAVALRVKCSERGWNPLDDKDASLNASELASLVTQTLVVKPSWRRKPDIDGEEMSMGTHRAIRGDWRRRVSKEYHGTPGDPIHDDWWGKPGRRSAAGNHNRCRWWKRESDRPIVAKKWGNAHGAKGLYFSHVSIKVRRSA